MKNVKSAIDIARYIINDCNDKHILISDLKLQKLLYLAQSFSLTSGNTPLFKEDIIAYDFGPVVPNILHEYRMFMGSNIPTVKYYYNLSFDDDIFMEKVEFTKNIFDDFEKVIIETVVDSFGRLNSTELLKLVQSQEPWQIAYNKGKGNIITLESMKEYFAE